MLKLNFKGNIDELKNGIFHLQKCLDYEFSQNGTEVKISKCEKGFCVFGDESGAEILYERKCDFFRALGFLVAKIKKCEKFNISQTPNFDFLGFNVDCSRNAALTFDGIKRMLEYMAVMGFNTFSFNFEDMYELENYPYFGYMRGRYSYEELKAWDDYAFDLGIEIIPYVQTLGHLHTPLKWQDCRIPKDTAEIVLVGDEKTYEFLDELIRTAIKPFRSRKISVGMDEPRGLGTGTYKRLNGFKEPFDIATEHMKYLNKIFDKYGLTPITSADMFFEELSETHYIYDSEVTFTTELLSKIPKNYIMCYWDYQHLEQEKYEKFIDIFNTFGNEICFYGGILTWSGMVVNYNLSLPCSHSALRACIRKNIKRVVATVWGDDGSETNYFSAMLGFQLYAEYCYTDGDNVSDELLKERFFECTGGNMEDFKAISQLDCISLHGEEVIEAMPSDPSNPSKWLLYNDVMLGLMDKHIEIFPISDYYKNVTERLKTAKERAGKWEFVFDMPYKLAKALVIKSDLGLRVTQAYKENNRNELKRICDEDIPKVKELIDDLRITHRKQWLKYYKPFGWEVLDYRYGGVLARLDSSKSRIYDYLNGEIECLSELEEERLYYEGEPRPQNEWDKAEKGYKTYGIGRVNTHSRMISAGQIVLHS